MSKHKLNPVVRLNEIGIVDYSFYFETGADGTVTSTSIRGQHWTSITRTDEGTYTLVLDDTFRKYLAGSAMVHGDNDYHAKFSTMTQGTDSTTIVLLTRTGGAKADVDSGTISGFLRVKATIAGEGL